MDTSEQQQQTQYPYQQQQPPSSSYDPSQSYEAYYAYHHHHQYYDPSSYPQQHYHQYYDPSSYPHQLYYDHSSTQAYPPPTQIHNPPEQQPPVENPAAAAAMEALSQLSQFAGDMDAAEKAGMAYNPHHYPQHYSMEHGYVSIQPGGSGRGRRGGGPFRGGGRRGGGAGRGRGRGRGRSGGRKPHQSAASSPPAPTAAVPTPAPPVPVLPVAWCDICRVECNSLEILEQHKNGKRHKKTAQRFEEIQRKQKLLAEYQAKSIPDAILPSAADVVEAKKVSAAPEIIPTAACFSTQVGEPAKASATDDHNAAGISMQVCAQDKASATDDHHAAGISMQVCEQDKASATDDHHAAGISMQVGEQAKASATDDHHAAGISMQVGEQPKTSATDDNNAQVDGASKTYNAETEQNSESKGADIEGSTGPPGTRGGYNRFNRNRGGGMKRNIIRYGRGGKRLKSFEPVPRRVPERQRVCTLCNVMCETLAVFDTHIAGKKHISKMKRCQGPGSVYGPITVYIPPNQPSAYPATQGQEPVFYGLKSCEIIHQHTTYMGMSGLQAENYPLHQGIQFVQNRNAEGGVSEQQQVMQGLETNQGKEVTAIDNTDPQDPANAPLVFESKKPNPSDGSA